VVATGIIVDGEEILVDYAEETNSADSERGPSRRDNYQDLQASRPLADDRTATSLSIVGFHNDVTPEEVWEIVQSKVGAPPVNVTLGMLSTGTPVAYVEMPTPAKAQKLLKSPIESSTEPGRMLGVRLMSRKEQSLDHEMHGKVTGMVASSSYVAPADLQKIITDKIGEELQDVEVTLRSLRFRVKKKKKTKKHKQTSVLQNKQLSSAEVAARLYDDGVEHEGRALRLRFFQPRDMSACEQLFLPSMPIGTTEQSLIAAFQAAAPDAARPKVSLIKTFDGRPRFAFIMFPTVEDAVKVIIDICVSLCG
jgi:hypothetical protein